MLRGVGLASYFDSIMPLPFAHRGGAKVAPNLGIENSIAAFQHAYELGYRYFETDVRATADGVAVACHDERLDRLSGDPRAIAEIDSHELESLLLGSAEQIVAFDALLEAFPDVYFNVDIKSDDAVAPTIAVLREREAVEKVCLASFDHTRLAHVRKLGGGLLTSASTREAATMVIGRDVPEAPLVFQVPVRHKGVKVVTRRFIDKAYSHGKHVHVWPIDDPGEMHRLLDLGVDGIITDRTDHLKDVLIERGQWKEPT